MYTILGAGLAGLSCAYHLGHENCEIFEQHAYVGGHIHSDFRDGFTWDEGPHVSFTKHEYVKQLFADSTELHEYPVYPINYYKGNWVPHPAQTNLYALPDEVKQACVADFLAMRAEMENADFAPANYQQWLEFAYGKYFADTFPGIYTDKYWTTKPENLTIDWVGSRMYFPAVNDVVQGAAGPLQKSTHYVITVRYPKQGGYFSFAQKLAEGANVRYGKKLTRISFANKILYFADGTETTYDKLINTLPLPVLIQLSEAPAPVKQVAAALSCSSILLINIIADHPTQRPNNWIYVYDEDKYSSRINFTELLSPANGVPGKTGIQVEVYFSKYRALDKSPSEIVTAVCTEMVEMGLVRSAVNIESAHSHWVEWANVIFDHSRREALNTIFDWLTQFGMPREAHDLEPTVDWDTALAADDTFVPEAALFLAGRFGQWNYFWTDDCVLRGKYLSKMIAHHA